MPGAEPPVWLLDVDGVLNASRPRNWPGKKGKGFATANGERYEFSWSVECIRRFRELLQEGVVEARWCSTWNGHTAQLGEMWGLPPLESAWPAIPPGPAGYELKFQAAQAVVESGRRLVWTDDDVIPWLGNRKSCFPGDRCLLIAPLSHNGLRPEHLDAIEAFCRSTTAEALSS